MLATLSCEVASSETENAVEAVTFCPDTTRSLVVTGTLSGKISFWDIPSQIERSAYDQKEGVVKMVWHPKLPYLIFSAGLDGVTRLIDSRNGQLVRQFTGHTANILDLQVSRYDGQNISFQTTKKQKKNNPKPKKMLLVLFIATGVTF